MNNVATYTLKYTTAASLLLVAAVLTGCGGESTTSNPATSSGNISSQNYTGPAASTTDVQLFKLNVWDNLVNQNRCGSCHSTGGQSPTFVRADDINRRRT
jgi:hypothetical protein